MAHRTITCRVTVVADYLTPVDEVIRRVAEILRDRPTEEMPDTSGCPGARIFWETTSAKRDNRRGSDPD